jgi:hypothetical protein
MPSRNGASYAQAFKDTLAHYHNHGHFPELQRADNETSRQLERFLRKQGIQLSFVPPSNHRANAAERSIRDVKNHMIATFATADPAFPLSLWDELLQQVEITINLLRPARNNPHMSAYEAFYGRTYDFVAHPHRAMRYVALDT